MTKTCFSACSRIAAAAWAVASVVGVTAPAYADTTCTGDTCVVNSDIQTPAGTVTVTAAPNNVVTVHLTPIAAKTFVYGAPFEFPPGPPAMPGYSRTSIATASAGTVNIDVFLPSGPINTPSLPTIVIISIHPPSPCRPRTVGSTVTFTPIGSRR